MRFNAPAGTSEFARRWNPQTGDIFSFKHHGYLFATKKPKFPTLHRLRTDLQWEDVVNHWKEPNPIIKRISPPPPSSKTKLLISYAAPSTIHSTQQHPTSKPKGYWMNVENRRAFFFEYAKSKGFDPLEMKSWTKVSVYSILKAQVSFHSLSLALPLSLSPSLSN